MKRRVTFLLLCAAAAAPAHAQTQLNILAGATFAELRGIKDVDLDRRSGAMGGLSLVIPLGGGMLALQPEALVTSKGSTAPRNATGGVRLSYAEIPVLLRLNLVRSGAVQPHLYAGPYAGYQISCRIQGSDADCDDAPGVSTNTVDIGGILGGGVTIGLSGLRATIGARYGFGVSKVAEFDVGNVRESARTGTYAVYLGLGLGSR
jgi:hypothetical protein